MEFNVKDLSELINHILEEVGFFNNRVIELQSYINKGTIEFDYLKVLKICYTNLEPLNLTKGNIGILKQFKFRVFTTFSKNLSNLRNLFDFTEFTNFY